MPESEVSWKSKEKQSGYQELEKRREMFKQKIQSVQDTTLMPIVSGMLYNNVCSIFLVYNIIITDYPLLYQILNRQIMSRH